MINRKIQSTVNCFATIFPPTGCADNIRSGICVRQAPKSICHNTHSGLLFIAVKNFYFNRYSQFSIFLCKL